MWPPSTSCSDAVLLAGTRADPDAFAAFYRRYERLILGYMLRRTGDPELAADLSAEVFASALRSARRYRPEGPSAVGWLLTIAQRILASSRRRGRVEARARRRVGIREAVVLSGEDLERIEALASLDGQSLALLDGLPRASARPCAPTSSMSAPTATSPGSLRLRAGDPQAREPRALDAQAPTGGANVSIVPEIERQLRDAAERMARARSAERWSAVAAGAGASSRVR